MKRTVCEQVKWLDKIKFPFLSGTDHVFMSFGKALLAKEQDDTEILLSVYTTDI